MALNGVNGGARNQSLKSMRSCAIDFNSNTGTQHMIAVYQQLIQLPKITKCSSVRHHWKMQRAFQSPTTEAQFFRYKYFKISVPALLLAKSTTLPSRHIHLVHWVPNWKKTRTELDRYSWLSETEKRVASKCKIQPKTRKQHQYTLPLVNKVRKRWSVYSVFSSLVQYVPRVASITCWWMEWKPNYSIASEWLSQNIKTNQAFANSGINSLVNTLSTIQHIPSFEYPSFSLYRYLHPV